MRAGAKRPRSPPPAAAAAAGAAAAGAAPAAGSAPAPAAAAAAGLPEGAGVAQIGALLQPSKKRRSEMQPRDRAAKGGELIASARIAFLDDRPRAAMEQVMAALRFWPYDPGAYQLLGALLERNGDHTGAVQMWMLQAHFERDRAKRRNLYRVLYQRTQTLGMEVESVFCVTQLLKLAKSHQDKASGHEKGTAERHTALLTYKRLELLERIGEWRMVEQGYRQAIAAHPFDARPVLSLCQLFNKLATPEKGLAAAESFIARCVQEQRVPCDEQEDGAGAGEEGERTCQGFLNVCNIAAEVHLDGGRWSAVIDLVEKTQKLLGLERLVQLHPDLVIKHCIANLYRGETDAALQVFEDAQSYFHEAAAGEGGFDGLGFGELYFDFSQALLKLGHHEEALRVLTQIREQSAPIVWFSIAKCHAGRAEIFQLDVARAEAAGQHAEAAQHRAKVKREWRAAHATFARVHEACPENAETRACLAEAMIALAREGDIAVQDEALRLLDPDLVASWSPDDTLRAAYQRLRLLRKLRRIGAAHSIATDILQACTREEPPRSEAQFNARGRFDQLVEHPSSHHPRQRPTQPVLLATRVTRPVASAVPRGDAPAATALTHMPVGDERNAAMREQQRAQVAAASRRRQQAQAQHGGSGGAAVFRLNRLVARGRDGSVRPGPPPGAGAAGQRGPADDIANLASLEDDLEVEEFLEKVPQMRKFVRLLDSDDGSESDQQSSGLPSRASTPQAALSDGEGAGSDGSGAAPSRVPLTADALRANQRLLPQEPTNRVESYLLNEFFTNLPRRLGVQGADHSEQGSAGDDAPRRKKEDRLTAGAASRWHCGTVRRVLVNGDAGRGALFAIMREMVDDIDALTPSVHQPGSADELRRIDAAQRVVPLLHSVVANRHRLYTAEEQDQARQLLVGTCFALGDFKVAFAHIRRLVGQRRHHTNHFWNVLNQLLLAQGPKVELRALFDTLRFHPHLMSCFPLFCILGNAVAYRHGSTKLAIGPFLQAYRLEPQDPMVALMIGVLYLRLVMSRSNPNRHYVALQAFAFANEYSRLRMGQEPGQSPPTQPVESETHYNNGRFYHQLGLAREASHYYRLCLAHRDAELERAAAGAAPEGPADPVDAYASMHREAAYNLHLIVLKSGNPQYARYLLRKYVTV
eukprot:TRINITY_DN50795_c0_g1_i1.p1 TRINITY_DN50795_c0_g1~~TRINITY_DN50795_c0_g1_i1.p1  ORF type:complete len:1155 (+),score=353.05 TRINITY_DN50795_c0_g1_i1:106-3570(+)